MFCTITVIAAIGCPLDVRVRTLERPVATCIRRHTITAVSRTERNACIGDGERDTCFCRQEQIWRVGCQCTCIICIVTRCLHRCSPIVSVFLNTYKLVERATLVARAGIVER